MGTKLFAVFTSYLRARCAHMARVDSSNQDRFRLSHRLNQVFLPSTRQRSLALAQPLGSFPALNKDKPALECILNFEQLVMQHEEASGSTYDPSQTSPGGDFHRWVPTKGKATTAILNR